LGKKHKDFQKPTSASEKSLTNTQSTPEIDYKDVDDQLERKK